MSASVQVAHALLFRPALAVLAGVLLAVAFPPVGWGICAVVGVGLLTWIAVTSSLRLTAALTTVSGLVFYLVLFQWISVLGTDAWVVLSLYSSLWFLFTGLMSWLVTRVSGWPIWIGCVWVLQEALRDRLPFGGFPWGRLAFSQSETPAVGYASLGGAPLITFAVAVAGAALAGAIVSLRRRRTDEPTYASPIPRGDSRPSGKLALLMLLGTVIIGLGGVAVPRATAGESTHGPSQAVVAVIQGSVPSRGLDAMSQRRAVLDNHVRATLELADRVRSGAAPAPELLIWPENSSDLDPYRYREAADLIARAADAIGVPILIGAVAMVPGNPNNLWNVGIVWNPGTGPGQRYIKRHPVPFGEYIPFRSIVTQLVSRYDRVPFDFLPGDAVGVLNVGPARIGDVICFEVADDSIVRDAVVDGGRALAVQTNNATYGGTAQPDQQLAMAKIRAIEHSRSVMVAATSGVTAIFGPDGGVLAQAPVNETAELTRTIALRDSPTLADRVGAWPEWAMAAAALLAGALGLAAGFRSRQVAQDGDDPDRADRLTHQSISTEGPK